MTTDPIASAQSCPSMGTATFRRDSASTTFIRASVSHGAASTGGNGLRVLLVDDNLLNQVYGEALIERSGFRVTIASDGADAVRRWKTEPFDLILMDCHMPVMDGFAAARRIREGEFERGTAVRTPIVALTGCTDDDEREDCINAGMDAILRKPFNPDELLAFVTDWSSSNQASLPRMPAKCAEAGLLAA